MNPPCLMKRRISTFLAAVLLTGAAAAAPKETATAPKGAAPVTLRFKVTAKEPQIYEMQTTSINRIVTTTGQSMQTYTSKKTLHRSATALDDGQLSVSIEDGGGTFEIDGKPAVEKQPGTVSTAAMTITSTGHTLAGRLQVRGEVGGIDFVLPEKPVSVGDTWEATAPERADFPIPLKVVFKLRELKQSQGRHFAIVNSSADIDEKLPERHVGVRLKYVGTIAFDIEGGFIAQANNSTDFKLLYLAENRAGFKETQTESRDVLKLVKKP